MLQNFNDAQVKNLFSSTSDAVGMKYSFVCSGGLPKNFKNGSRRFSEIQDEVRKSFISDYFPKSPDKNDARLYPEALGIDVGRCLEGESLKKTMRDGHTSMAP